MLKEPRSNIIEIEDTLTGRNLTKENLESFIHSAVTLQCHDRFVGKRVRNTDFHFYRDSLSDFFWAVMRKKCLKKYSEISHLVLNTYFAEKVSMEDLENVIDQISQTKEEDFNIDKFLKEDSELCVEMFSDFYKITYRVLKSDKVLDDYLIHAIDGRRLSRRLFS